MSRFERPLTTHSRTSLSDGRPGLRCSALRGCEAYAHQCVQRVLKVYDYLASHNRAHSRLKILGWVGILGEIAASTS
jgi:hypothetical protein